MIACLQVWLLNLEQNKIPRKLKRGNQLRDLTALFKSLIPRKSRISFSDKLFRSQITCYIFTRIRSTWALACTSSKLDMPAEKSDSDFTVHFKKALKIFKAHRTSAKLRACSAAWCWWKVTANGKRVLFCSLDSPGTLITLLVLSLYKPAQKGQLGTSAQVLICPSHDSMHTQLQNVLWINQSDCSSFLKAQLWRGKWSQWN